MVCSKFHYLNQEPIFSGRKIGGPDGAQKGSKRGPVVGPDGGVHVL